MCWCWCWCFCCWCCRMLLNPKPLNQSQHTTCHTPSHTPSLSLSSLSLSLPRIPNFPFLFLHSLSLCFSLSLSLSLWRVFHSFLCFLSLLIIAAINCYLLFVNEFVDVFCVLLLLFFWVFVWWGLLCFWFCFFFFQLFSNCSLCFDLFLFWVFPFLFCLIFQTFSESPFWWLTLFTATNVNGTRILTSYLSHFSFLSFFLFHSLIKVWG